MGDDATFTAFVGPQHLATGSIEAIAETLAVADATSAPPMIFDDATGRLVELNLRFGPAKAATDFRKRTGSADTPSASKTPPQRGRGRPRLGVVAREVTLLPRHWDWLAAQPGGASAALRRLVDGARRSHGELDLARERRDAAYRVMSAVGGDLPGFEEASRALFAGDVHRLVSLLSAWPADVGGYVMSFLQDRR